MKNVNAFMKRNPIVFYVIFLVFMMLGMLTAWSDNNLPAEVIFARLLSAVITVLIPAYVHSEILIPRYFNKRNWPRYAMYLIVLLGISVLTSILFLMLPWSLSGKEYGFLKEFVLLLEKRVLNFHRQPLGTVVSIVFLSCLHRFVKFLVLNEQEKARLKAENLKFELSLLKGQVNPHFLLNSINNIYGLALEENADKTAEYLSKLGTLMRYVLHEAEAPSIVLQKEMEYLEQYVEMQKMRISNSDGIKLSINIPSQDMVRFEIAPVLLIPFIENAFKYGVSGSQESNISIQIGLENGRLLFKSQNVIQDNRHSYSGGLGLKNVENRLRLIYPDKYELTTERRNNSYFVKLHIDLYPGKPHEELV